MSRNHYIPACFIARFSSGYKLMDRSRNQKVWIFRIGSSKASLERASSIGYENDLYEPCDLQSFLKPDEASSYSFDDWSYEKDLCRVLNLLEAGQEVSLSDWVHVVTPFLAGIFVRGRDFNRRFINPSEFSFSKDTIDLGSYTKTNTNLGRHIMMERLLPQLLASQYVVYHFCENDASLISNDLCLTPMIDPIKGLKGWAIPISTSAALGLFPCKSNRLAKYVNGSWVVKVNNIICDTKASSELNEALAQTSSNFIIGSDETTVESLRHLLSIKSRFDVAQTMESLWFDEHSVMTEGHELDWYVVASIANTNIRPDEAIKPGAIPFQTNPSLWHPSFFEFPSAEEWKCGVAIEDDFLYCFCQGQPPAGKPQLASS